MEYLRRYILFRSSLQDPGGCAEDAHFPPPGEIHAQSLARHLSRFAVLTSNVDLLECFGWFFVVRIESVAFQFILHQYSDEWLVHYDWGLFKAIFRKGSLLTAIKRIDDAVGAWQPEGAKVTDLRFFSRSEFHNYNLAKS